MLRGLLVRAARFRRRAAADVVETRYGDMDEIVAIVVRAAVAVGAPASSYELRRDDGRLEERFPLPSLEVLPTRQDARCARLWIVGGGGSNVISVSIGEDIPIEIPWVRADYGDWSPFGLGDGAQELEALVTAIMQGLVTETLWRDPRSGHLQGSEGRLEVAGAVHVQQHNSVPDPSRPRTLRNRESERIEYEPYWPS